MQVNKDERLSHLIKVSSLVAAGVVNAAAVGEFKKAVVKYTGGTDEALKNLYGGENELGALVRAAFDEIETRKQRDDQNFRSAATGAIYPKGDRWYLDLLRDPDDIDENDDDDDDDDEDDDDEVGKADHYASTVANLLVESGRFPDRPAALDHLLRRPGGQALLARMRKAAETAKEVNMDRTEALRDVAKTGVVAIAKAFLDEGRSFGIGEEEFTQLMTEHAQRMFPDKTPDAAFAKLFTDSGADSVVLRKAHALTKGVADPTPTMVGGPDAIHEAVDNTESSEAYRQLEAMASKLRVAHPELSPAQAFSTVFTDKQNAQLAAKAHRRPTPPAGGAYPFPR